MKPFFPTLSPNAKLWLMGLTLLLALHPALAKTASEAQEFTLKNGMTLIVKVDPRAPTAVHMLWVRVGSMDEVDGVSGVAHVLEHMLFKGTAKVKQGEFSRRVAAWLSSATSHPRRTHRAIT